MTFISRLTPAIATAAILAATLSSGASPASERTRTDAVKTAAPAMDAAAAIATLRAAGYGEIRKLEWEHGVWEARASDAQGRRVKLCVDATSAAVAPCRK